MQAFDYYQKYQRAPLGSTIATRRANAQDILSALQDRSVDYHVANATEKE